MALTFQQKTDFFHQANRLSSSGLPLVASLELVAKRRKRKIRIAAKNILEHLKSGEPPDVAFAKSGDFFSELDLSIIRAGDASGSLPETFSILAAHYASLQKMRQQIIARCLYPLVVLHLCALLLPISKAIRESSLQVYLIEVATTLGCIYGILLVLYGGWKFLVTMSQNNEVFAKIAFRIPLVGGLLRLISSERFATVLALQTGASISLLRSIQEAGVASGNAALQGAAFRIVPTVRLGAKLSDSVQEENVFPEELEVAFLTAENSGHLENEMETARSILRDKLLRRLNAISEWLPRIFYFLVTLYVAWQIVSTISATYKAALAPFDL
ncbi:MAG: type II secretion system F family protein [Chthoniobacterales bacterium]